MGNEYSLDQQGLVPNDNGQVRGSKPVNLQLHNPGVEGRIMDNPQFVTSSRQSDGQHSTSRKGESSKVELTRNKSSHGAAQSRNRTTRMRPNVTGSVSDLARCSDERENREGRVKDRKLPHSEIHCESHCKDTDEIHRAKSHRTLDKQTNCNGLSTRSSYAAGKANSQARTVAGGDLRPMHSIRNAPSPSAERTTSNKTQKPQAPGNRPIKDAGKTSADTKIAARNQKAATRHRSRKVSNDGMETQALKLIVSAQ